MADALNAVIQTPSQGEQGRSRRSKASGNFAEQKERELSFGGSPTDIVNAMHLNFSRETSETHFFVTEMAEIGEIAEISTKAALRNVNYEWLANRHVNARKEFWQTRLEARQLFHSRLRKSYQELRRDSSTIERKEIGQIQKRKTKRGK